MTTHGLRNLKLFLQCKSLDALCNWALACKRHFHVLCQAVVSMHLWDINEQNVCSRAEPSKNYNPELFPLNSEGWIMRKRRAKWEGNLLNLLIFGLQSAGILIEIKFLLILHLGSRGGEIKTLAAFKRRSSSSFSTVNKKLWSQPFKIGFTWINKSCELQHCSWNRTRRQTAPGNRLWCRHTRHCE